jgi:hypothetical protein
MLSWNSAFNFHVQQLQKFLGLFEGSTFFRLSSSVRGSLLQDIAF